jgi:hypothetical protein
MLPTYLVNTKNDFIVSLKTTILSVPEAKHPRSQLGTLQTTVPPGTIAPLNQFMHVDDRQGDQIGPIYFRQVIYYRTSLNFLGAALCHGKSYSLIFGATVWSIFSPTHLVTLMTEWICNDHM